MEIKTKFKIGQEVYAIFFGHIVKDKIDKIAIWQEKTIYKRKPIKTTIRYWSKSKFGGIDERKLFKTRAEAQAECDKRNKGE